MDKNKIVHYDAFLSVVYQKNQKEEWEAISIDSGLIGIRTEEILNHAKKFAINIEYRERIKNSWKKFEGTEVEKYLSNKNSINYGKRYKINYNSSIVAGWINGRQLIQFVETINKKYQELIVKNKKQALIILRENNYEVYERDFFDYSGVLKND